MNIPEPITITPNVDETDSCDVCVFRDSVNNLALHIITIEYVIRIALCTDHMLMMYRTANEYLRRKGYPLP